MKKILVYVNPEKQSSLFDVIVAHDSGSDVVVPYSNITNEDINDIVYSSLFTRRHYDLQNTAIFIGGHNIEVCEGLKDSILDIFKNLPEMFRVSIALDPDGAYTTSSACMMKIKELVGNLSGINSTVLAGTGAVGQSTAVLLAKEGSNVTITSRKIEKANEVCDMIKRRYGLNVNASEADDEKTIEDAIQNSEIVVSSGPEGVNILPKRIWLKSGLKIMADMNSVPPYGIEGIDAKDDGTEIENGKIGIGAMAIGGLKMKCHRRVVETLFESKNNVLDLENIYKIAESI